MSTEANATTIHPCQAATILPVPQSAESQPLIRSKLPIPTNEIGEYSAIGIKYYSSTFQKATIMRLWIVKVYCIHIFNSHTCGHYSSTYSLDVGGEKTH